MNELEPAIVSKKSSWLDRFQALFEVILLGGLLSSLLAWTPFLLKGVREEHLLQDVRIVVGFVVLEAAITLTLLAFILKAHRESLRDLGWRWERWKSDVIFGFGLVPILFLVNIAVAEGFRQLLPQYYTDRNPLIETIRSPQDLALFIVAAIFAGGIKEEIQRAFILKRFREHLGGVRLGLILWSVAFGAGHYLQGAQGVVAAGLFGLLFGIIYLIRGNLLAPMAAHGAYDTVALLGYWLLKEGGK